MRSQVVIPVLLWATAGGALAQAQSGPLPVASPASSPLHGRSERPVNVKVKVRHVTPSELLRRLDEPGRAKPPGLDSVVPYEPDRALLVRGTPDAVAWLQRQAAALDVPLTVDPLERQVVGFRVRLVRVVPGREVMFDASTLALDDATAPVDQRSLLKTVLRRVPRGTRQLLHGLRIGVTPHVNANKSVHLSVEIRRSRDDGSFISSMPRKQVPRGSTATFSLPSNAGTFEEPVNGNDPAFVLEVTPTVLEAPPTTPSEAVVP